MSDEAPGRPDVRPARTRRSPLALVLLGVVLAVTVAGGYVVAGALETPSGPPAGFPGVVVVRPLVGWAIVGRAEANGWPFVRLTRGAGNLDVAVRRGEGAVPPGPVAYANRYLDEVLRPGVEQLSVAERLEPLTLDGDRRAVRFRYAGLVPDTRAPIEGEVTVVLTSTGTGVVFDAWAPEGLLPYVVGDARAMIGEADLA